MNNIFFFFFLFFVNCIFAQSIQYPNTPKEEIIDVYHEREVDDFYQWMENDTSSALSEWKLYQQKSTESYLSSLISRPKVKMRLTELMNYEKVSQPILKGDKLFYYKNDGLKNQSILYIKKISSDKEDVFIDPNKFSEDGTVSMSGLEFSKDNKYCSYSVSNAGSDWKTIFIMEIATKKVLDDKIENVKFGNVSWGKNGFYYSGYDKPKSDKMKFIDKNEFQKVYYHKLNTKQGVDVLIYENKEIANLSKGIELTEDEQYLVLYLSKGTSGNTLLFKSNKKSTNNGFKSIYTGYENDYHFLDNIKNRFLILTDENAPNKNIISINPENPKDKVVIIPENKYKIQWAHKIGNIIFVSYLKDVSSYVVQYDIYGAKISEIQLPGIGTIDGLFGDKRDTITFYTFSSYLEPASIYRYNIRTKVSSLYYTTKVNFDKTKYETNLIFYPNREGVNIPLFLVHKKNLELNGNNPVFLYGYGGFNISMTPGFNPINLVFLEKGGIYAVACIRGGGEYGESWHKAGILEKKQKVFNDFIDAAEYLINRKYTNPQKLAIHGRSNGGLLVGACINQRPEFFKVAIATVGVYDMLRYQKFTIGWAWATEYGLSDSFEMFNALFKYSPYHNVKEQNYPATMILTADHDDRVVPSHSYKFGARLQLFQKSNNPILIRIDKSAGHGSGKPTDKLINEWTDILSFTFYHLGM